MDTNLSAGAGTGTGTGVGADAGAGVGRVDVDRAARRLGFSEDGRAWLRGLPGAGELQIPEAAEELIVRSQ